MGSGQILAGRDDTEAVLGGGTLRLAAPRSRTDIPLVVVREVRADGREVVVELTDGAVHRLDGTNPTAAGVFAAALTAALPQERDPAGSGRVIVTRDEPREPNPRGLRFWVFTVVSGILVAGYLGFLVFSAVNHGPEVIFGILAAVPLLLGYAALVASVALGPKYAALARRGITVMAWLSHRSRKGQSAYEYADPEGASTSTAPPTGVNSSSWSTTRSRPPTVPGSGRGGRRCSPSSACCSSAWRSPGSASPWPRWRSSRCDRRQRVAPGEQPTRRERPGR